MFRRLVILIAAPLMALAGVVVAAPQASAAPQYPPSGGTISVSAVRVVSGQVVRVRACGYRPGTRVRLTDTVRRHRAGRTQVTIANRNGCANFRVRLHRPGRHTLTTSGRQASGGRLVMSVQVRVIRRHRHFGTVAPVTAVNASLASAVTSAPPATSSSHAAAVTSASAGGGLLGAGLLLVGLTRHRRRDSLTGIRRP